MPEPEPVTIQLTCDMVVRSDDPVPAEELLEINDRLDSK